MEDLQIDWDAHQTKISKQEKYPILFIKIMMCYDCEWNKPITDFANLLNYLNALWMRTLRQLSLLYVARWFSPLQAS